MATIKVYAFSEGVSDCGRYSYQFGQNGVTINGRFAYRGDYVDLQTGYANAGRVDAGDWDAACDLMCEVDAAHQAWSDGIRDRAHAIQDAQLDDEISHGIYSDQET